MSYYIYADDVCIYDPYMLNYGRAVLNPKLTLEVNKAGSLTFTLPPDNVGYNDILKLTTIIRVKRGSTTLFKGRVINDEQDFYKRKQIYCEGMLSFLVDSYMRPYNNEWTVRQFLTALISNHNSCVESSKRFVIGTVSLDTQTAVKRTNAEYTKTLDIITSELIEKYGGFIRVREESGVNYIDYISAYSDAAPQVIEFGKNLMGLSQYLSAENVFTVLVPLGARITGENGQQQGRLTIASVNGGSDRLENTAGINLFGRIEKVQEWDDIQEADILKAFGELVLDTGVNPDVKITISAVDLSLADTNETAFALGNYVRMISEPHGVDTIFQITKIDYDLASPDQTTYEFEANWANLAIPNLDPASIADADSSSPSGHALTGSSIGGSYSSLSEQTASAERKAYNIATNITSRTLDQALENASKMINAGIGGKVYILPDEIYILGTNDPDVTDVTIDNATYAWRWNTGGLGYWSGDAGGLRNNPTYLLALTSEGEIVAERITAGTITAAKLEAIDGSNFAEWLDQINDILGYATGSGNTIKIGTAKAFGSANTIGFEVGVGNSVIMYPGKQITWHYTPPGSPISEPVAPLMVFHNGNSGYLGIFEEPDSQRDAAGKGGLYTLKLDPPS